MCRVYSDMWLQVRRDRIARDIVFAHSVYFGVCCCTHFPFHLLSERRPFHHLFSLFLVQHLSISPLLFIPLLGCACKFGRVHRSCCNSLKVLWLFFFFFALSWSGNSLLFRSVSVAGETFVFQTKHHIHTEKGDWTCAKKTSIFHLDLIKFRSYILVASNLAATSETRGHRGHFLT